ncbi:rhodanese-like domain-containing protein [Derxia gummosa]|uniref:Rhodanese-like domain-containing protein n=1 Tax=Derxia gummosa DSM 723 TaxID=1121388 RepID=A0A8B6X5F8_9BURK|nr:rhodanese-like domain-containing protein [Derxia gummosa]
MKFLLDNWYLVASALVSGGLLLWPVLRGGKGGVSHHEATRLINDREAWLVDVRSTEEFARGHIAGARNIPVDQLEGRIAELNKARSKPVIVVCQTGPRAQRALAVLTKAGFAEVVTLEGGVAAWQAAGLPLRNA